MTTPFFMEDVPLRLIKYVTLLDAGVSEESLDIVIAFKAGTSMAELSQRYHTPLEAIEETIRTVIRRVR